MLSPSFDAALRLLSEKFDENGIAWALTGSTAHALWGLPLSPRDIDIQTTEAGAYVLNGLLKDFVIKPVSFSSTGKVRSHFGLFEINSVPVEIMGNIEMRNNEFWDEASDILSLIRYIAYKDMKLPVLDLSYESKAYKKMGRFQRAEEIDNFLKALQAGQS